jgi:hypothetical protein
MRARWGLEGIVSKRLGSRYRSGRSSDWLKFKNPDAPAVKREAEEDRSDRKNGGALMQDKDNSVYQWALSGNWVAVRDYLGKRILSSEDRKKLLALPDLPPCHQNLPN